LLWNFRELSAAVSRMAILADEGRIGESLSLADAGRKLFAATRSKRSSLNDSDRLRKYLARFDLDWVRLRARP
jgi:sigma54-dependent transcription regulator